MDNRKKIIFGLIAGIIFIVAFILNLLFPPKPFVKSAHADGYTHSFVITSGSLNQSIAIGDATLQDWLEVNGLADETYTYNDFNMDLAALVLGSYTGIDSDLIDQALETVYYSLLDKTIELDTESGFIRVPHDVFDDLSDFQHEHGYDQPSQNVIGSWVLSNNSVQRGIYIDPDFTSRLYSFRLRNLSWGEISDDFYITVVGSAGASASGNHILISSTVPGIIYYYINGTYQDYIYMQSTYVYNGVTYYYCNGPSGFATGYPNFTSSLHNTLPKYASNTEALADLWGGDHPSEPVFNGKVYLDDDPSEPMNILNLPGNDGKTVSINRNTAINNTYVYPYGGYNNISLKPNLSDIPNNYDYQYPTYPEVPHDLPEIDLSYPQVEANQEIQEGMNGLNSLWVILLTMGGSFIVLKVIL